MDNTEMTRDAFEEILQELRSADDPRIIIVLTDVRGVVEASDVALHERYVTIRESAHNKHLYVPYERILRVEN